MRRIAVATLAVCAVVALPASVGAAGAKSVKIGDDWFVKQDTRSGKDSVFTVSVKKGTKVTWRWVGDAPHNVTVTKGPVRFRSSTKTSGTYTKTMSKKGSYTLTCTVHAEMDMKLRVS